MAAANVRRVYVLACFAYFLRFTAAAAFAPYVFMWLEHHGHGNYTRSVLGTLSKIAGFISPMLWGALADWSSRHRLVFTVGTTLNALAVASLTLFP